MIRRYEDFEVVITKHGDQLYANLDAPPDGDHLAQPIPIVLPGDFLAWIEVCQGRKKEAELAELGYRLFDGIIRGELAEKWHARLDRVKQRGDTGLRLRFSTQTDALNQVPLELLCRPIPPPYEFLALSLLTPIVRSPRSGGAVKQPPIALPLRMLVVVANPSLQVQVDPIAEQKGLEGALDGVIKSGRLMIDYLGLPDGPEVDSSTLNRALFQTEYPYDIVHFIGHGGRPDADDVDSEGALLMMGKKGGHSQSVRASDVAGMLAYSGVRLAVLQACEGAQDSVHGAFRGVAQQLIAHGLPAVIAMQCRVDKDVAARFCAVFYDYWLNKDGLPIEHAVTQARITLRREFQDRVTAWVTPVLFIGQGSTEALVINLDRQPFSIQIKRGGLLLERGEIGEAVAELEVAYRGAPDQARGLLTSALVAQAQVRRDEGDIDGALRVCERALEISPDEPTAQEIRVSIEVQRHGATLQPDALGVIPEAAPEGWEHGHRLDDRYEIVERIAITEFCEIYRATELRGFRRIVAIKRLKPDELLLKCLKPDGLQLKGVHERFEREIAILGRIEHSCVLRLLHDGGKVENGDRYFVTQFADKGSLTDYLHTKRGSRLNCVEALKIAKAICRGIDAIHSLGIIHRDIKPGNIFLFSEQDGSISVRLADFSIAGVPLAWLDEKITQAGEFMGTYPYTAPEQFDGSLNDPRLDLYAWAVVFFEMLTGKPFAQVLTGESGKVSLQALVQYYRTSSEDKLSIAFFTDQGIPQEFAAILQKALRRDPRRRYQSAQEPQKALDTVIPPPIADIESAQELEQKYNLIRHLVEQEEWTRILRLTTDFDTDYRGPDGQSVGEIQARALYEQGKKSEVGDPESAYYLFYELYTDDPNYGDVADRCAAVAFRNGTRQDIHITSEQRIEWLEKVIRIDPSHRKGHTQQQLYRARHRWAKELLEENKPAAIAQLERVSPDYDRWAEVCQILDHTYYWLGIELLDKGNPEGAVKYLEKIHPDSKELKGAQYLVKTSRWRIRGRKIRAWIKEYDKEVALIGVLSTLLGVVLAWLQLWHTGPLPTVPPSATLVTTSMPSLSPATSTGLVMSGTQAITPSYTPTVSTPSTVTPSAAPSRTSPTSTVAPSATPPRTPTPSSEPVLPTISTPTLTPTRVIPTPVPLRLLRPAMGIEIQRVSRVEFEWEGSLRWNQAFQVTVRHTDTNTVFKSPVLTAQTWIADLPAEKFGDYSWQVTIVQNDVTVASSEQWHFCFNPFPHDVPQPTDTPDPWQVP